MGTGRLVAWLKQGETQEDVFIPAKVAALLRLKLVRADRLSTLVAIASGHRPQDPHSELVWRGLMDAQQDYEHYIEVEPFLQLAKPRTEPKPAPSLRLAEPRRPESILTKILSCGKRIWGS